MLPIVALARGVSQILRPNQNSVSRWGCNDLDVVRPGAGNVEFGSLEIAVEVVNVHQAVVLCFREDLSILPCHQIARRTLRSLVLFGSWTENETIELTIVCSGVFLYLTVNLGERWKF